MCIWLQKINCLLKHTRTENVTDTNILIKSVTVYVGACGNKNEKESEPWWKRRIKTSINKVRKIINISKRHQRGETRKEK